MEISQARVSAAGGARRPPGGENPATAPDQLPVLQGSPGTATSLLLRAIQCVTAVMSLVAMISAADFYTVPSFSFLVAAAAVHSVWTFCLTILDIDIMLISKKSSQNHWVFQTIKFGDVITGTAIFCAASASSGVFLFLRYDRESCSTEHCAQFEAAITRAFISFTALLPSLMANWLTWSAGHTQVMFWTDCIILFVNLTAIVFAAPSIAMGVIIHCHDPTSPCITFTAFGLSIVCQMIQFSASVIEVIGQLIAMHFPTTTPAPEWPLTCMFIVAAKWFLSVWTLGTACASIGVMDLFFMNNTFLTSTNDRAVVYCAVSLTTGAFATISSCVTAYLAVSRCFRRRQGQQ